VRVKIRVRYVGQSAPQKIKFAYAFSRRKDVSSIAINSTEDGIASSQAILDTFSKQSLACGIVEDYGGSVTQDDQIAGLAEVTSFAQVSIPDSNGYSIFEGEAEISVHELSSYSSLSHPTVSGKDDEGVALSVLTTYGVLFNSVVVVP
jgi:hypothetical protein